MTIIFNGMRAATYSSQLVSENKLLKIKWPTIERKTHKRAIGISLSSDDINASSQ